MLKNKYINFALLFIYSSVIFYLSSLPKVSVPLHFWSADKLLHFIEYGIYGALVINFLKDFPLKKLVLISFLIGILYGASDEIHQAFVPGRDSSVLDWFFDCIGVYLGIKIYLPIFENYIIKPAQGGKK